jgi:putative hemolysin
MSDFILENEGFKLGSILVRLAQTSHEIEQAQKLRYHIFYEEFHAKASAQVAREKRDFDEFDDFADHLIVIDTAVADRDKAIVGTYRMMRNEAASRAGRFYTSHEFDISGLTDNYSGLLEMGRSCVLKEYRTKAVLQLLWQGIAEYASHYHVKFLFGCASFHGTNPNDFINELSYLHHNHLAPEKFRPIAHDKVIEESDYLPLEQIDPKQVLKNLPPLIKGYIRLGGFIGEGIYIDHDFDTVDVCVVVKTALVTESYLKHYERKTGVEFDRE